MRQLQMLQLIPRSPAQITVQALTDALKGLGFIVSSRTVQRDLNEISNIMPLECNDHSKPYGWIWSRQGRTQLPLMSLQEALSLHFVHKHLLQVLPPTMLEDLEPLFVQANQTIENLGNKSQVTHWVNSVIIEPPTQPRIPPQVSKEVQETVYQAVFEQKQLEVEYQTVNSSQPKHLLLHPLGLIQRGVMTYLGATVREYEDVRLFALHRITAATIKPLDNANPQNKRSWKSYLETGAAGFGTNIPTKIKLGAWIDKKLAQYLTESPLGKDQEIKPLDDGQEGYKLSVSVNNTWQLRWWILSHGTQIVVKSPHFLRENIKETVTWLARQYE
jgi:predicted DNA-binding transcriptional regulator YafY